MFHHLVAFLHTTSSRPFYRMVAKRRVGVLWVETSQRGVTRLTLILFWWERCNKPEPTHWGTRCCSRKPCWDVIRKTGAEFLLAHKKWWLGNRCLVWLVWISATRSKIVGTSNLNPALCQWICLKLVAWTMIGMPPQSPPKHFWWCDWTGDRHHRGAAVKSMRLLCQEEQSEESVRHAGKFIPWRITLILKAKGRSKKLLDRRTRP